MARTSTDLSALLDERDGISRNRRALPALDPASVSIEERSSEDLLRFVRELCRKLHFYGTQDSALAARGNWSAFAEHPELTEAAIASFIADPARFAGEQARWLGRPHFALLLTFLELFRHARGDFAKLTERHLTYYYRRVLQMSELGPQADRAVVCFRLAKRFSEVRLPAGTPLSAGRDASGASRTYLTERELTISRAFLDEVRAVYVHRKVTSIADARLDRDLSPLEALGLALRLALGRPRAGDAIPPWRFEVAPPVAIDPQFFIEVAGPVAAFSWERMSLRRDEFARLMLLRTRRQDSAREWDAVNSRLGFDLQNAPPPSPTDFMANLQARVGPLDFSQDELPQVDDIDDVYRLRNDPAVRTFIEERFAAAVGYESFTALMPIKLRIDAEWREINGLLELAGARIRGLSEWSLPSPLVAEAFEANLEAALGPRWPPPWMEVGARSLDSFGRRLRALEAHLAMPAHDLTEISDFAHALSEGATPNSPWESIEALLGEAHRQSVYAERRRHLAADVAGGAQDVDAFLRVASEVLGRADAEAPLTWEQARNELSKHLARPQLDVLDAYRNWLVDETAPRRFEWEDVLAVFELAGRIVGKVPDSVAERIDWRNLYAFEDARALLDAPETSPRWKGFGRRPVQDSEQPPAHSIGWGVMSPSLALSGGARSVQLSIALRGNVEALTALGATLPSVLDDALAVEVSTEAGWLRLPKGNRSFLVGSHGDFGLSLPEGEGDRPVLQARLLLSVEVPPLTATAGMAAPAVRVMLAQQWDASAGEWFIRYPLFELLEVERVHLEVSVQGLSGLQLQSDDRALDPAKPFYPFGARPLRGTRFLIGHPELSRERLQSVELELTWTDLPVNLDTGEPTTLTAHYRNYPGNPTGEASPAPPAEPSYTTASFTVEAQLVDGSHRFALRTEALLEDGASGTNANRSLVLSLEQLASGGAYTYERDPEAAPTRDLRAARRYLALELLHDFGHGVFPAVAAARSRAMAAAKEVAEDDLAKYQVQPPYTPTIASLRLGYSLSVEFGPGEAGRDCLLQMHPFGWVPSPGESAPLFPRYTEEGELYLGLRDLDAPRHLSLMFQVAEGTANPDRPAPTLTWGCLDGDRWKDLAESGDLRFESTRGLINSGTVELALPQVRASHLLPPERYWLRVSNPDWVDAVCDLVDVRAQAVSVVFDDRGNDAAHYEEPLPVGSITALVRRDSRVAEVEQPYTSVGGRPAERPELFRTRVSERLRHKQRALSPWDYERLVLAQFPQVHKVKCVPAAASARAGAVEVIVIPDIRQALPSDVFAPRLSSATLLEIREFLAARAPSGAALSVRNPEYVPVRIRLGVRFLSNVDVGFGARELSRDLVRFLSPWAFDLSSEPSIGGKIYETSVLDFVDRLSYVDYATDIKLFLVVDGVPQLGLDGSVSATRPDQVLVSAPEHVVDVISELEYQHVSSLSGINYMKVELDFIVG